MVWPVVACVVQRQRNVRISSFALSPHEHSVIIGLASGAIRILVANEEHLLKKIETVLDDHFFGYGSTE